MSHFIITSPSDPRFVARVADCDLEHARSVLGSLIAAAGCPSDLELRETADLYADPADVTEPQPRRRRWR